ncbi:MAG: hypothetical protein H7X70_06345 [Candidatus Kapabacteria bacterium]|nr:hypothetical protein [Candidatus Kapabacteria bacterium]
MRLFLAIFLCATFIASAQTSTVLVDVFTNSHCSPCAGMHNAVSASITSTFRANNVIVVHNHWRTYVDDPIYQANMTQPVERASWLGGVSGTPTVFFNGARKSGSYNDWPSVLDELIATASAYTIVPVLSYTADSLILTYTATRNSPAGMPTVYGVLVENVTYTGRNGVSEHDGAMRALLTPVAGNPLEFNVDNVATGRIAIARQELWDLSKVRAVVSIQDPTTKKSLQAAQVEAQMATDVHDETFEASGPATADVVDVRGSIVSHHEGLLLDNVGIVSQVTRTLPSGAYFVRIVRGTSITVQPIAITR